MFVFQDTRRATATPCVPPGPGGMAEKEGSPSKLKVGDGGGDKLALLRPVDIYALGCIAWEVFTQTRIYDGIHRFMIRRMVLRGERPPLKPVLIHTGGGGQRRRLGGVSENSTSTELESVLLVHTTGGGGQGRLGVSDKSTERLRFWIARCWEANACERPRARTVARAWEALGAALASERDKR